MKKEDIIKINDHFIKGRICEFYIESDDYNGWFSIINIKYSKENNQTEAVLEDII